MSLPVRSRNTGCERKAHSSLVHLLLQFIQQIHGFAGAEGVEVGFAEAVEHGVGDRGEDGQLHRAGFLRLGRKLGGGGVFGVLVLVQHLAGAGDDFGGKAGELGDLDAVALVGGAG